MSVEAASGCGTGPGSTSVTSFARRRSSIAAVTPKMPAPTTRTRLPMDSALLGLLLRRRLLLGLRGAARGRLAHALDGGLARSLRVFRLVDLDAYAAGHREVRDEAVAVVGDGVIELDAAGAELGDGLLQVVAV